MRNKYVRFIAPIEHMQIPKFNGTSGVVTILPDNVGVLNVETGMYEFKEAEGMMLNETWRKSEHVAGGTFGKCKIKPTLIADLLLPIRDKHVKFFDSIKDTFQDEEDKELWEQFEIRLFTAKTQLDVNVARMFFEAGQIDRLSIKASVMRLTEATK